MEIEQFFKGFQDHLAPRLDTYEYAAQRGQISTID